MPIVELPMSGYSLSQGDILRGITLFATKEGWNETGGDAVKAPFKMCLVVSRPCVIAHKQHITVVGVEKYPEDTPREANTFDKVLDFMTGARDGITSPDVFYLGQLPDTPGRFCARLDSFHVIQIPPSGAALDSFVASRRVATLAPDFVRGLHTRIFGAFANLGFDDNRWPSTDDLQWIVDQGRADIAKLDGEVKHLIAQKSGRDAEDKKFDGKALSKLEEELATLRTRVKPYEDELAARPKQSEGK